MSQGPLASGPPAQLVVNSPGFVPLGADDMQPAQFTNPAHIIQVLQESLDRFLVYPIILYRHFGQRLAALLIGHVIGVRNVRIVQNTDHIRQNFIWELATQLDIHTTTGHIRGNGYRAKRAGP